MDPLQVNNRPLQPLFFRQFLKQFAVTNDLIHRRAELVIKAVQIPLEKEFFVVEVLANQRLQLSAARV